MKIPSPPSWHIIRGLNIAVAAGCTALAIVSGPTWIGMIDSALAGFTIASAVYITGFLRLRENFDGLVAAFNQMRELNEALVENRVKFHITGVMQDDNENGEPRRLH